MAPDEQSYLRLYQYIFYSHTFINRAYWGDGSDIFLKIVLFPIRLFEFVGIQALTAFRLWEVFLFCFALILSWLIIKSSKLIKVKYVNFIYLLFFLPSVVIWSSSGLRENFLYVEILVIIFGLQKISTKNLFVGGSFLFLGFLALMQTKFYLAILTCIVIFIVLTFIRRTLVSSEQFFAILFCILFTALFSFPRFTSLSVPKVSSNVQKSSVSMQQTNSNYVSASVTSLRLQECYRDGTAGFLLLPLKFLFVSSSMNSSVGKSEDVNQLSTETMGTAIGRGSATDLMNVEQQGKFHNPVGVLGYLRNFLLTPLPFTNSGSTAANLFELETVAWIVIYVIVGLALWRSRKQKWRVEELFCAVFSVCFILFSAETEVNVGTALRHRSLLLFPFAILLSLRWPENGLGVQSGLKKIFRK